MSQTEEAHWSTMGTVMAGVKKQTDEQKVIGHNGNLGQEFEHARYRHKTVISEEGLGGTTS